MAKRIAPLSPAVRYTHAMSGVVTYDVASSLAGIAVMVENLTANGHRDIRPLTVKCIYRGKVKETPCSRCGQDRPDVTWVNGKALCATC